MVVGTQRIMAVTLGMAAGVVVSFHVAFAIWSFLLLMELTQVEPRFYVALFCITDFGIVFIWTLLHKFYMKKYKPEKNNHASIKPGSVDLARASSMQIILFVFILWLTAFALIFDSRWVGAIAPGDGHVVQNGMDTRSGIYTIWLMILFNLIVGCAYVVANIIYVFDLYFNNFLYTTKQSVE